MPNITKAQLQNEVEVLRHNCDALESKIASLNTLLDAATTKQREYEAALSQANADALRVRVLEAQLAKAVEQRNVQLDAKHDALNAIADARIARAASRPQAFPRPIFEFDPNLPGDFARAAALAKTNNGVVQRIRQEHA